MFLIWDYLKKETHHSSLWLLSASPNILNFVPYNTPSRPLVAQVFLDNLFKLDDMTNSIVMDCDPTFTNNFW
jgi:hypothetical protein